MMMRNRSSSSRLLIAWVASALVWLLLAGWLFATAWWGSIPAVLAGCGSPPPDVRLGPSPEEISGFMAGCRAAGSAAYVHLQAMDLLYPAAVATFLALTLLVLTARRPQLRWIVAVPVLASLADYVENVAAWALIRGDESTVTLRMIQTASVVKGVLSWSAWAAVVVLAVVALLSHVARRRRHVPDPAAAAGVPDEASGRLDVSRVGSAEGDLEASGAVTYPERAARSARGGAAR